MELFIFARFHASEGKETAVLTALQDVVGPSRGEAGCVAIDAYRSTRDSRLFYIHSRWINEEAFEIHAALPHTVRFLHEVATLIDHPLAVTRTRPLE